MTTSATGAPTREAGAPAHLRYSGLDRLRGLAIVLMILDHVLLVSGDGLPIRLTVTRASLPLFALTAGALWRPGARRRHALILVAAAVSMVLGVGLGIGQPDVLLVLLVASIGMHAYLRFPVATAAVAALQATTWPVFTFTGGYEVGVVLVLMIMGRVFGAARLDGYGRKLSPIFDRIGRYPLTFYVGHLALLAVSA